MSRKGENIYKRKDNRWEARYLKGYGENGNAKYGYLYAHSYHEAKEKLERAKVSFVLGESHGSICTHSFSVYCDEWLELNRHRITESTYVKYNNSIKKHIKPGLGGLRAEAVSTSTLSRFTDNLIYNKGLSAKTVRDILTILSSILKYTRKSIGAKMPEVEIVYPKCQKKEMRVLSHEEQRRFIAYLLDDIDECKFGILLALITGLRIGELCALRWENISLEERCIKVKATMQRLKNIDGDSPNETRIIISYPKSQSSMRIIPLTDYAIELCRKFYNVNKLAFVLTGDSEKFCEPRKLQYRFSKIVNELGLCDVHFHCLRHTFATRCVEVGFEIKSLSEILGHSTPKITLERYVHSSIEFKRDNMQKLAIVGF